jgi:hypothetical protein
MSKIREYVRSLGENRQVTNNEQSKHLKSDTKIINDREKNRNQWTLEIVASFIVGRDGVV